MAVIQYALTLLLILLLLACGSPAVSQGRFRTLLKYKNVDLNTNLRKEFANGTELSGG